MCPNSQPVGGSRCVELGLGSDEAPGADAASLGGVNLASTCGLERLNRQQRRSSRRDSPPAPSARSEPSGRRG